MDAKRIIDWLLSSNIIRIRFFNFKLWGNLRRGIYWEFTAEDIATFMQEILKISTPTVPLNDTATPQPARELFKTGSNYAILARLCEQYYVYEGSDKLQKKIIAEVKDIIEELRNDSEAQAEFERVLDLQQNNVMQCFRAEHPTLKEKDYRLYSYLAAGLSATTIAVLLGKDKSVVYNRISRLKKVIK
ncbi:MAG: hypothetical protein IKY75_00635 [Bacteroidaceae bacterium]|nr:hypothetical protein [Bacteroidaceae bacterium]